VPGDPVPDEVRRDLRRIADRWITLPVGDAVGAAASLRRTAAGLVEATAVAAGADPADLPDLGPAVVVDQFVVAVYDACAAGVDRAEVSSVVAEARRSLP
jgi:hypothetical protein